MASSIPEEVALDPFAWAQIAQDNASISDQHGAVVSQLSKVLGVASCGLVCGMQMPRGHRPGQGVPLPGPEIRHGDFQSKEWTERTIRQGEDDPAPKQIGRQTAPLWLYRGSADWKRLYTGHDAIFRAMEDYGFVTGLFVFNVHPSSGNIDVAGVHSGIKLKEFAKVEAAFSRELQLAFTYFSEALELRRLNKPPSGKLLSPRELECLKWTAGGLRTQDIGERLKLSDATVNEYLTSARRKLGATNRNQASARAVLSGIISP